MSSLQLSPLLEQCCFLFSAHKVNYYERMIRLHISLSLHSYIDFSLLFILQNILVILCSFVIVFFIDFVMCRFVAFYSLNILTLLFIILNTL